MLGWRFRMFARSIALCLSVLVVTAVPARAQLPIPGVNPARDVPDAHEMPDPNTEYKVLFMVGAGPKPDEVNPTLMAVARYVNTLAKAGVPADKRKIAVMIRGGIDMILKDDAYKARHDGKSNPNIDIIEKLAKAGVSLRVCGQGVVGMKLDRAAILPEIQIDLWAMTTAINLGLQGYVRVG
jgi:intracellular sulfur oxidation DsrE/DsrF family protein